MTAPIVAAIEDAGLPAQVLDDAFELGYPPEAHHLRLLERGLVRPDPQAEAAFFPFLPYSIALLCSGTAARSLTLESPRCRSWEDRIAMHRIAVVTAIDRLRALDARF